MPLPLWGQVLIWIGSSYLMKLLTPKVKGPSSGPTDPEVDVSGDEGDPIPVVYGTCLVTPKVTWWGDLKRVAIKEVVQPAGFFNIEHKVTVATEHWLGMQMVICTGPIDELTDIYVGDDISLSNQQAVSSPTSTLDSTIFNYPTTNVYGPPIGPILVTGPSTPLPVLNPGTGVPTELEVLAPNALGGRKNGGGIVGTFRFYWGNDPQNSNTYLATKIAADTDAINLTGVIDTMPRWNRICYCVAEQAGFGESPQIQPLKFVVRRFPRILEGTPEGIALGLDTIPYYQTIWGEANPAEVILEVLTDSFHGAGVTANYDYEMFAVAAKYLYQEQVGVSALLQRKGSAKEFIEEVLRHIDGVLTQDPLTGMIGLKLQRPYADALTEVAAVVEATVTEDNCKILDVVYPGYRSNVNEVKITFTNASRAFKSDIAQAQELALMEMANGDIVSETYDYPFFTNHELAQKKAFQLLRQLRGPYQIRFSANRSFARIGSGSLIVVDLPERGISNMRFRVGKVDSGTMMDGEIEVEAIEDVFAALNAPYTTPVGGGGNPTDPNPGWREPIITPRQAQNFPTGTAIPGNGTDPGGAYGYLELGIDDPFDTITAIRFWKQEGTGARTGPVNFNIANIDTVIASEFVELDILHDSYIWWEVDHTEQDGATETISGMATFSKKTTPGDNIEDEINAVTNSSTVQVFQKTILADPPGQTTVLEEFPSALTDLDVAAHFVLNLSSITEVFLFLVVVDGDGCPGEIRLQYLRLSDLTWRYIDGTSGPAVGFSANGDIYGNAVPVENDARGIRTCRLVGISGDNATSPEIGHMQVLGSPLIAARGATILPMLVASGAGSLTITASGAAAIPMLIADGAE